MHTTNEGATKGAALTNTPETNGTEGAALTNTPETNGTEGAALTNTPETNGTKGAALTNTPETNGTKGERKKKARVIPENPLGYRPLEFAALLGVGKTKVFSMIRDGEVESVLIGRTRIVKASSVQALLERAA